MTQQESLYMDVMVALHLTKREQFAMAAMQGLCASGIAGTHNIPKNLSRDAVQHADALLAELAKERS